jgi:hypothetical protein
MRTSVKTTSSAVAKPAAKVAKVQTSTQKGARLPQETNQLAGGDRPPGVVRLGVLTRAKIRRAVAAALEGKTFEADA